LGEAAATGALELGIASRALPGQQRSGDLAVVVHLEGGLLVGAIDALGHGDEAAATAATALATIEHHAHEPLDSLVQRCHARLIGTRGAVMSLAAFRHSDHTMTWLGVGNVEGVLLSPATTGRFRRSSLMTRAGIVGGEMPKATPAVLTLSAGDTLVFTTDGIRPGFADTLVPGEPAQDLADRLLAGHARDNDDALVLVVRNQATR
jgi:negative regulator of sigma-B (phosphoserine phosphatase)